MTTLFIGNTTKQHNDFVFKMPETGKTISRKIVAGTQEVILRDATDGQVNAVIDQHKKYGLISETEAKKAKNFIGLLYSTDKPIKLGSLQLAFHHNQEILEAQAEKNLEHIGQAAKNTLDQVSRDGEGSGLPRLELEVVEEAKDGKTAKVAKGVEMTKPGVRPAKAKEK